MNHRVCTVYTPDISQSHYDVSRPFTHCIHCLFSLLSNYTNITLMIHTCKSVCVPVQHIHAHIQSIRLCRICVNLFKTNKWKATQRSPTFSFAFFSSRISFGSRASNVARNNFIHFSRISIKKCLLQIHSK